MTTVPSFDVAVVGAGIHGIHLTLALLRNQFIDSRRVVLIDPAESPFALWRQRVRNCGMDYLRSNGSHGVATDFYALRKMMGAGDFTPPYHRPSTSLFARHLGAATAALPGELALVKGRAAAVEWSRAGEPEYDIHWTDVASGSDGPQQTLSARCVILAPGQPDPLIPDHLKGTGNASVVHIHDNRFNPDTISAGSRVLIAGGGIAAFHLALYLSRRHNRVELWHRDPITVHQFDSDPCFIGPRCSEAFESIADEEDRHLLLERSRRGGSVPPDLYQRVMREVLRNRIVLKQRTLDSPRMRYLDFDRIVLSTGFSAAPPAAELIQKISGSLSAPVSSRGFPLPQPDLSWVPGVYVSGGLADLILGPPARNIVGAHLARRRIIPSLRRYLET